MRSLFAILKSPIKPVFLYEYQSHRPKRHGHLAGFCSDHGDETVLFVVFDGGTQRHFSSVRIIVYCDIMDTQRACVRPIPVHIRSIFMNYCTSHPQAVRRLEPLTDDKSRD